jgi:hypothetical protein
VQRKPTCHSLRSLSSLANREPLHLFTGSSSVSRSFDPTFSRHSLVVRSARYILSLFFYWSRPDLLTPDSHWVRKLAFEKAYNSNHHLWHPRSTDTGNMSRSDTDSGSASFGLEFLEPEPSTPINRMKGADSTGGRVKGPVACMLAYNKPALCLFGESMSDTTVRMATQLAESSDFPVIIRPLSEYPSELAELR